MTDNERLLELTQSYLKSLVCGTVGTLCPDFDGATPFGELGVDSFRVLKIIKALEADFGRLPKTLLFENFNINDLAAYFIAKHEPVLRKRFATKLQQQTTVAAAPAVLAAATQPAPALPAASPTSPTPSAAAAPSASSTPAGPIVIAEKAALAHAQLGPVVRALYDEHKNEGSVSRGTRNIAPHLFIGADRTAYFNFSRSNDIVLAYAFTGPREAFPALAAELHAYCDRRNLQLSILVDEELPRVGDVSYTSTPFGALQRILDLKEFSLDGKSMRRLRYQVSKFEKAGACRTEEFRCGADAGIAARIAAVIDEWCAARTMVNPLIHIVKDEILAGTLDPGHRIFVTYVDDALVNVILISPLAQRYRGYLMDLEFYPASMPLGGLEFAIVRIVERLVAEGCEMLSLGGTYGCKLASCAGADPRVEKILDDLRMQNIFNDEGNLQFKNKFRPQNTAVYLCRAADHPNPDDVLDIIMMIADPMRMQTPLPDDAAAAAAGPAGAHAAPAPTVVAVAAHATAIEGAPRSAVLARAGFNPLNVAHADVDFDLKTDSWAQLRMPAIADQRRHVDAQLHREVDVDCVLRELLPFAHFVLTTSGRTAENVFCRAWPRKGTVPQNLLFPTTIYHQIDKGFTPRELPHPDLFDTAACSLHKSEIDCAALEAELRRDAASIGYVCIELSDNAAGGCPVSLAHLRRVKALLAGYSVPLVLDGTRVLENACHLVEADPDCAGKDIWRAARELLALGDAVLISLAKDFQVEGGLIATHDADLGAALRALVRDEGCGLATVDRRRIALTLEDRAHLEAGVRRRRCAVQRLWAALRERGMPVAGPAGAHCVLIDVKKSGDFARLPQPAASFLAWLYVNTGIRAGLHSVGMQRGAALGELVRLAIPVGLRDAQVDEIIERVSSAFSQPRNIPEIIPAAGAAAGDVHARYELVAYHAPAAALVPAMPAGNDSAGVTEPQDAAPVAQRAAPARPRDIAIIGMAGRYPKARNLDELWQNLAQGRDCIEDIPDARLAQRLHNGFTRKYRGGFVSDVDRFDARFFNISAREAEVLDPQERLFLEVACEAIEDAGYFPETLARAGEAAARDEAARDVGVFVGAVWSMYQMLGVEERMAGNNVNPSSFFWSIANRVSYWMNLTGPSLTLDTACSASLTALHLACESLQRGECSAAIVGGVNLDLHQAKYDINSEGGSHSSDGVCRSFGKGANGYVSGEGVGALLLKPLEQALADGDYVHGVIKGAAVTHSGRTGGYTVPAPHAQSRLIRKALRRADLDARSIGYVEAHGTGTDLGDSIEIAGLSKAFHEYGVAPQSCALGCVKTNVGHLEAASGVIGVQKVLLQMKHRTLVPSLHSSELNEGIDFASSPFHVQQLLAPWDVKVIDGVAQPRRAGISAIGAGGTSAHVILEEYVPAPAAAAAAADLVFPLSAPAEETLREMAARLRGFLQRAQGVDAGDVAHTLQRGRKCFDQRLAIVARGLDELAAGLDAFLEGRAAADVMRGCVANAAAITGLLSGAEKQDFIQLLARGGDLRRLARLWSDGVVPDWRGFEDRTGGRRIPLPTYPFAGERYWIGRRAAAAPGAIPAASREPARPAAPAMIPERSGADRAGRYQFSFSADAENVPGRLTGLTAEEQARLFVRQLVANQLRASLEDVDDAHQLMETGITSLDMAEMTQFIKQRVDPAFSPIVFFECTTVRSLAELLARTYPAEFQRLSITRLAAEDAEAVVPMRRKAPQPEPGAAGRPLHVLDAESELPEPEPGAVRHERPGEPRRVFLTGATGFLGIHVLAELQAADADAIVFCLVRATDARHGLQRILDQAAKFELGVDAGRIRVMCGDIGQPRLGLSTEDWDACCAETREIVHASARVNHIEGYATFRDSTRGMKEVIRLAGSRRIKLLQFVSSIAGCALKRGGEFSIFEKEEFVADGAAVYGGYGQSKWVQETLLRRAHAGGIPYIVYRFGELAGSARTGLGQVDDMLHRLVQMRLAIGCREKVSNDVLDMVPVDVAARLIAASGARRELWNGIVHATHTRPYGFVNLYKKAQKAGLEFATVTRAQYLERCYDFVRFIHAQNPVHAFVLECVLRDTEGSMRGRKMMDAYFAVLFPFAQDNFRRALATLGMQLPDWDALVELYLRRWDRADCGFMARIRAYQQWSARAGAGQRLENASDAAKGRVAGRSAGADARLGKASEG